MSLITGIQKYSIHDGKGIRTTVFFKGCHLNCMWCHNPETKSFKKQLMFHEEKCTDCKACQNVCPIQSSPSRSDSCLACGACTVVCPLNLREIAGKEYEVIPLFNELKKDEMFYEESGGGVTLSGGEVMAGDIEFIYELMKKLDRQGIRVTIDTCGMAPVENFEKILPYTESFLYDVKLIDEQKHIKYVGASNKKILENLEMLSSRQADIYIRIPVIKEVNGNRKEIGDILNYLKDKKIHPAGVNLLPYHNTGSGKYDKIDEEYKGVCFSAPSDQEMQEFVELFQEAGFNNVKIGG